MGRKSKLSEADEAEIKQRLLNGEHPAAVAKRFKVSRPLIIGRFADSVSKIKETTNHLLTAEDKFSLLSVPDRLSVITFAERLRNISNNMAMAAELGSMTAYLLSGIARKQVDKIDHENPMDSQDRLQAISALTKISNDSAAISLSLINSNKDRIVEPVTPKRRIVQIMRAEELEKSKQ